MGSNLVNTAYVRLEPENRIHQEQTNLTHILQLTRLNHNKPTVKKQFLVLLEVIVRHDLGARDPPWRDEPIVFVVAVVDRET